MSMKRFIAGVICPSCKGMDKIFLEQMTSPQRIRCISCGFTQLQPADNPKSREKQ